MWYVPMDNNLQSCYFIGANGTAVILLDKLTNYVNMVVNQGWEDHAFNVFVSDLIPLNRSLPDLRDQR